MCKNYYFVYCIFFDKYYCMPKYIHSMMSESFSDTSFFSFCMFLDSLEFNNNNKVYFRQDVHICIHKIQLKKKSTIHIIQSKQ